MANTVLLKKSGTASATPSSLTHGELAINYADGKLYYKNSSDSIIEFQASATPDGSDTQIQYNDSGSMGSSASLTFDGTGISTGASSFSGDISANNLSGTNTGDNASNSNIAYTSAIAEGNSGLVPADPSDTTKFLRSDGTWVVPSYTTNTNTNQLTTFTVSATTDTNPTTISQGDDLMFTAGTGITCETTADGTVTITNSSPDTTYTHPTTAGNKHIPTGGSAGKFLKYSSSGTATWETPSYTTNTECGGDGHAKYTDTEAVSAINATTSISTTCDTPNIVQTDYTTGADVTANNTCDTPHIAGDWRGLGNTSTTACAGNDSRLSDARTPTSHTHDYLPLGGGDLTGALNIGSAIGTRDKCLSITTGSTGNSAIAVQTGASGHTNVWSVLPHNEYIFMGTGIYYDGSTWVHQSSNAYNSLFGLCNSSTRGASWWASSNSTGSWNQADNVPLWNTQGQWNGDINTTYNATFGGDIYLGSSSTRIEQYSSNVGRIHIHGSGDNYLLVGCVDDNGWGYIESQNNANGLYLWASAFRFDAGHLGSYDDGEVDLGVSGNRFRNLNISGTATIGGEVSSNTHKITESGKSWYNINANYLGFNTWIQSSGQHALYAPSSGFGSSHWYPSNNGSHGAWRMVGNTGGYGGFYDEYSAVSVGMHDSAGNGGTYRVAQGKWHFYFLMADNCLGVNTSATSSSYGLYVNGAIYATGDVVAYSDARVKTNIETIDNPLDKVMALRGVYYNRIDEGEETSRKAIGERCVGMIAQELNEVLPEAVTYAKDIDRYGIDYGKVTSVLIEAIKELKNEVNELRSKYGVN